MTATTAPALPRTKATGWRIGSLFWSHRWIVACALLSLGLGVWFGIGALLGPSLSPDHVVRGSIVETVVASGNALTPFRVNIASQIVGTVKTVQVDEGATVAEGQPLILLDDRELRANLTQAKDVAAQADARIVQLDKQTLPAALEAQAQAKATLLNEQKTFDRTADLTAKGVSTRQALDDAQKTLDVARAQLRADDLAVYSARPGGSDFILAQSASHQASAALRTALARLGYAEIVAPRGGVLMTRNVESGTVAQPGATLMVLAPAGDAQLEVQIDERNLGKIAIGQRALASADAYPERKFAAVVSYINPGVDLTRGSVLVKLAVAKAPDFLLQDMTVSVDIEVGRSDGALVLPARAVRDALTTNSWVMGVRNGRAVKIPVKLGLRGDAAMEIKSGLSEGDAAIPAASGITVGQRVRAAKP